MKLNKNIAILPEIIKNPEKDWSNHYPFIKVTEEDWNDAEKIIAKYHTGASREDALAELLDYKSDFKKHKPQIFSEQCFVSGEWWDFIRKLKRIVTYRKRWNTQEAINSFIDDFWDVDTLLNVEEQLYEKFNRMLENQRLVKMFARQRDEEKGSLEQTFSVGIAESILSSKLEGSMYER